MVTLQQQFQGSIPAWVHDLTGLYMSFAAHRRVHEPKLLTLPAVKAQALRHAWFAPGTNTLRVGKEISLAEAQLLAERLPLVLPFSATLFTGATAAQFPLCYALGAIFDCSFLSPARQHKLADMWIRYAARWVTATADAYKEAARLTLMQILTPAALQAAGRSIAQLDGGRDPQHRGSWPSSLSMPDLPAAIRPAVPNTALRMLLLASGLSG
jgi:hypothetical protein